MVWTGSPDEELRGGASGHASRRVRAGGDGWLGFTQRKLVGVGARIALYPTLAYNVARNKIQPGFHWFASTRWVLLSRIMCDLVTSRIRAEFGGTCVSFEGVNHVGFGGISCVIRGKSLGIWCYLVSFEESRGRYLVASLVSLWKLASKFKLRSPDPCSCVILGLYSSVTSLALNKLHFWLLHQRTN